MCSHKKLLLVILLSGLLATTATGQDFAGKIVAVKDGDTIEVMHEGKAERIRLEGIDCPEHGQPFGTKAETFTSQLAFGKEVTVKTAGKDRYGRTLGEVILPDGKSLNKELVANGLAWWYKAYSSNQELMRLESEARSARRGLWMDYSPTPPWEWRHGSSRTGPTSSSPPTAAGELESAAVSSESKEETVYVTRTGAKYHREGCRYLRYSAIPMSLGEAKQRYSPCSVCNPPVGTSKEPDKAKATQQGDKVSGETTPTGKTIYVGPRGGRYHISKSGKKVYEKRSRR
jgi:endonuclease YncB( thermonuclease family)